MDSSLKTLRKNAFLYGLLLGITLLVIDIITLYAFSLRESMIWVLLAYLFGSIILPLSAAIGVITRLRDKIGGYWNQREATSGIFIVFLCAYLVSSFGRLLCFQIIPDQTKSSAINNFASAVGQFLTNLKFQPHTIENIVKSIRQQFDTIDVSKIGVLLPNLMFLIIILFVVAFIFGNILKRSPKPGQAFDHNNSNFSA